MRHRAIQSRVLRAVLVVALLTVASESHAQRLPDDYERILLPFVHGAPSATGSWSVETWMRNDGDLPLDVFPLAFVFFPPVADEVTMIEYPSIPPRRNAVRLLGDVRPSTPGPLWVPLRQPGPAFIYVEKGRADDLLIGSHLSHRTREGERSQRTSVPHVHEDDFHSGRTSLIAIPIDDGYRYALRIFADPDFSDPSITIRFFEMQPRGVPVAVEIPLATTVLQLRPPVANPLSPCDNACDLPDVAYVPAIADLFSLATAADAVPGTRLRVEIEPSDPELRFWAVVSSTSNETNGVGLYY